MSELKQPMKIPIALWTFLIFSFAPGAVRGQGTFQNLDFESAIASPENWGQISFTDAFPGWIGYLGQNSASEVIYGLTLLNTPWITLVGSPWYQALQGNYMVSLQAWNIGNPPAASLAALAQFGTVPSDAQSFWITAQGNVNLFEISFAGTPLGLAAAPSPGKPWRYAADISALAGMSGELRMTINPWEFPGPSFISLDEIVFSSQPIPEPGTAVLLGVGGSLWLFNGWRIQRRRIGSNNHA